jgi:hypothetical protein
LSCTSKQKRFSVGVIFPPQKRLVSMSLHNLPFVMAQSMSKLVR